MIEVDVLVPKFEALGTDVRDAVADWFYAEFMLHFGEVTEMSAWEKSMTALAVPLVVPEPGTDVVALRARVDKLVDVYLAAKELESTAL